MKFKLRLEAIDYQVATVEIEADTMAEALRMLAVLDERELEWRVSETEKTRVISIEDTAGVMVSFEDMDTKDFIEIDATSVADNPEAARAVYEARCLDNATPPTPPRRLQGL